MTFAETLKRLREAAGLSQQELAEKAGMAKGSIAKLEQGERPWPSFATVVALASALGVDCTAFTAAAQAGNAEPGRKAKPPKAPAKKKT